MNIAEYLAENFKNLKIVLFKYPYYTTYLSFCQYGKKWCNADISIWAWQEKIIVVES